MIYDFNSFTEKHKSRYETLIGTYKNLFNHSKLVGDYITLCANQTDEKGHLSKGSELFQLMKEKFLSPEQFHGVDTEQQVIDLNLKIGIANWYCADIYSFLVDNIKIIKPSIINLDTVFYSKKRASHLLSDTLLLLTDNIKGSCMVSLNVMVNNCYETHHISKEIIEEEEKVLIKELESNHSYRIAAKEGGWEMFDKCYLYCSTDRTVMCTYIFYRR